MKKILIAGLTCLRLCVFGQNITQGEYFIDADKGFGKNNLLTVTAGADISFPATINFTALSTGFHFLYLRSKDSDGKWSFTARRSVEVLPAQQKNNIIAGEYFIDTDPGTGKANAIIVSPADSLILQNFTAITKSISPGFHLVYGRLKDTYGRWSETFRRSLEVLPNQGISEVVSVEYFFRKDPGYGKAASIGFIKPSPDSSFSFTIPNSQLIAGADTLFLRVKSSPENYWSITTQRIQKITLPLNLLSFNVVKHSNMALLNWQTADEVNSGYFNIQRSTNGAGFTNMGKLNAMGGTKTNNGYGYTFMDDITNLSANKIYYRLEIVDRDGATQYSNIKSIDLQNAFAVTVLPNPVKGNALNLAISTPAAATIQLSIFNASGKLVYADAFKTAAGTNNKKIKMQQFSAGAYFLQVSDGTHVQPVQFIKAE